MIAPKQMKKPSNWQAFETHGCPIMEDKREEYGESFTGNNDWRGESDVSSMSYSIG